MSTMVVPFTGATGLWTQFQVAMGNTRDLRDNPRLPDGIALGDTVDATLHGIVHRARVTSIDTRTGEVTLSNRIGRIATRVRANSLAHVATDPTVTACPACQDTSSVHRTVCPDHA